MFGATRGASAAMPRSHPSDIARIPFAVPGYQDPAIVLSSNVVCILSLIRKTAIPPSLP
jgi:hypothetical protein